MIKKILLVNPPNQIPKGSVRRISEPLGLLYIAAAIDKNGFDVEVYDMACEGYNNCEECGDMIFYGSSTEELYEKIDKFKPDLIGISCMFSDRISICKNMSKDLKSKYKDIVITIGGIPPTDDPEIFLKDKCIDYVIMHEGEERIVKLINVLNTDSSKVEDVDGICYLKENIIVKNEVVSHIADLDKYALDIRKYVDMEKYFEIGAPMAPFAAEQRVAHVITTRGCPQNCCFCSSVRYWGRKVRKRTVDNIIQEIDELVNKYGVREIQFIDDNITVDNEFAKNLFERLIPYKLKWCTPNGLYFNSLDEELIKLMAESGAYQLSLAVESANERVLKDIVHKNVKLSNMKKIVDEIHKYDIGIHAMFIVGFPGETYSEIMNTLNYPFDIGYDSVSYFIAFPLYNTPLYELCKEKGYLKIDQEKGFNFKTASIVIPKSSPDFVMENSELEQIVEDYTVKYNEFSTQLYPERNARKFENYLRIHPEDKEIIKRRVT